jgi:hypothetical protein
LHHPTEALYNEGCKNHEHEPGVDIPDTGTSCYPKTRGSRLVLQPPQYEQGIDASTAASSMKNGLSSYADELVQ